MQELCQLAERHVKKFEQSLPQRENLALACANIVLLFCVADLRENNREGRRYCREDMIFHCEKKKSNRAEIVSFGAIRFDFGAIRFRFGAIRFFASTGSA
jgi:hypothetical protein